MEDKQYIQHMESQLLEEKSKRLNMERHLRNINETLSQHILKLETELADAKATIEKMKQGKFGASSESDTHFLEYLVKFESAFTDLLTKNNRNTVVE